MGKRTLGKIFAVVGENNVLQYQGFPRLFEIHAGDFGPISKYFSKTFPAFLTA